jgi:hypothetical protein
LPLFGVTLASLADYVTTDKDHVKKISKMPNEKFLMGKNRQKIETEAEEFVEDDFNDEWIVVDKDG